MSLQTVRFDAIRLNQGDCLLDLGCGEGRHAISAYMAERLDAVGVDLSLADIKTTRDRFAQFADAGADIGADAGAGASADTDVDADANTVPDNDSKSLALAVADGQHLPFASQRFDKVICSEVLEHIPDHLAVVKEIGRVIKVGGILAVSVPRFFPEWICWRLSDAYHQVEGGHIHIFRAGRLRREVEATGFVCFRKHHAHALHVPYWWLKCLFWRDAGAQEAKPVAWYHRLLDWDLMQAPHITRFLDWLLNPLIGKSLVMYFIKTPDMGVRP